MSARRHISFMVLACSAAAASAETIDGTVPLVCTATHGHDCLPTKDSCGPLERESKQPPVLRIDFAKGEVHSPFRAEAMRVEHSLATDESLILQGGEQRGFAWSALIKKKDAAFTLTIADREGAYVIFGTCKVSKKT